jgi:hypothetical protein
MIGKYKINKSYVSPIDVELAEFNQVHPKSPAQLAEIRKYARIYELRDHPIQEEKKKDIWSS